MRNIFLLLVCIMSSNISFSQTKLDTLGQQPVRFTKQFGVGARFAVSGDSEISGIMKYNFSKKSFLQLDAGRIIGPGIFMSSLSYRRLNPLLRSKRFALSYGIGGSILRFKADKDKLKSSLYLYPTVAGGVIYDFRKSPFAIGVDAKFLIAALRVPNYSGSVQNIGINFLYSFGSDLKE